MGCKNTKEAINSTGTTNPMGTKAILERKLYLVSRAIKKKKLFSTKKRKNSKKNYFQAKESPEPVFDLSECGVKEVPSGVFVLCKVLRKEQLLLSKNLLKNLHHGGALEDLYLIQVLDLSHNLLKVVPDLCFLKQLKVGKHLIREFKVTVR